MYQHSVGYRHKTGEVEGFKGHGFTAEAAKNDARRQIVKKLDMMQKPEDRIIEENRILTGKSEVSKPEMTQLRADWEANYRY